MTAASDQPLGLAPDDDAPQGSLELIRRVRDDLNTYFYFGLQVA
jgi:hypothetical protein